MTATLRMSRTVTVLLILALVFLLFVVRQKLLEGGPAGKAAPDPTSKSPQTGLSRLADDICTAAREESPAKAREIFEEKIHGPLHMFAGRLADKDRTAAARLLQDKHAVEAAIQKGDPGPLSSSLYALSESTVAGLKAMSIDARQCEPHSPLQGLTSDQRSWAVRIKAEEWAQRLSWPQSQGSEWQLSSSEQLPAPGAARLFRST